MISLITNVGSFTKDASSGGSQSIAGVGFKPATVLFLAVVNANPKASWGFSDSSRNAGSIADDSATTADSYTYSSNCIDIRFGSAGSASMQAVVSSYDSDGFTLSWARTGSPSGTITVYYLAL